MTTPRVDVDAIHDYLSNHSYWARGRSRDQVTQTVASAARVIGLYDGERQIGFPPTTLTACTPSSALRRRMRS